VQPKIMMVWARARRASGDGDLFFPGWVGSATGLSTIVIVSTREGCWGQRELGPRGWREDGEQLSH
jgi:hypothetical protein